VTGRAATLTSRTPAGMFSGYLKGGSVQRSPDDLPEAYKALRAKDEVFWQEQERNIQGGVGQPCCTLSGISSGLLAMRGNFALVIHGEDECAGCFRHMGPSTVRLFCTGLTEKEFVTGQTAEPLRRCLRVVARELDPEAIFVLGACPVEVIGDRFETVVEEINKEFAHIPMIPMHTSGLKVGTQTAMLDWWFSTMAALPMREPLDDAWRREIGVRAMEVATGALSGMGQLSDDDIQRFRDVADRPRLTRDESIAVIGMPRPRRTKNGRAEYVDIVESAKLRLIGDYPHASSLDQWRALSFARNSFVADKSLYPKLMKVLEGNGQNVEEVPLPIGVASTTALYDAIGRATGRAEVVNAACAAIRAEAEARVETFRARFNGMKLAYGLRMNNNYQADELAYQGLGDYAALLELGFDVTLLVQGPPDKVEKFSKLYDRRGMGMRFQMFAEPWVLGEVLREGGFDVAFVADHCRTECQKAGVAMVRLRSLDPYYEGAIENCEFLTRTLTTSMR
jgi:hypothetical protein